MEVGREGKTDINMPSVGPSVSISSVNREVCVFM